MADEVDIPLSVSVPGIEQLVQAQARIQQILDQANTLVQVLNKDGNVRGLIALNRQFEQLQKLSAQSSEQGRLLQLANEARTLGRAVDEQVIQKLLQVPQALAAAARSNDIEGKLVPALTAYGRKLDEAKLKVEALSKAQDDGTAKGQRDLERQVASAEANLAKIETNIATATTRLNNLREEQSIVSGVASRQRGVEVARRFEDTPEGQEIANTKKGRVQDQAERINFDRDAALLSQKQRLERAVEVSAATNEDRARTRSDQQYERAQRTNIDRDAATFRQRQRLERAAEVSAATNEDRARTRSDQEYERAQRNNFDRDAAGLRQKQRLERAAEVSAATNEDRARNRQTDDVARAGREDFTRAPQNIAAQARSRLDTRLEVAELQAADPASIEDEAALKFAQQKRREQVRAQLAQLRAPQAVPSAAEAAQARGAAQLGTAQQLAGNEAYIQQQGALLKQQDELNAKIRAAAGRQAPAEEGLLNQFGRRAGVLAQYTALGFAFGALGKTFESVVHLENALKEVGAVSGSTTTELERLRGVIIDTSTKTPYTSIEVANLAREMVQAGISSHSVTESLGSIATLASATGGSLKNVGEIFTSAFEVFKLRGSESAKVADQLAVTLTKSRLGTEDFARVVQTTSTTAAESGLSFTELQAALAALANQGLRSGTQLSQGFRQVIVDLEEPPVKLAARFRELGLTSAELSVKTNGLNGVLDNLKRAGFSTADAFATLPARTAQAFAAFLKSGQDLAFFTDAIGNASGAALQNAQRMESLENQAKRLGNSFIALTQTGAGPLIGVLKATASGLTSVTDGLGHAGGAFSLVTTVVTGVAVAGLLRYVGVIGAVGTALGVARSAVLAFAEAQAIASTGTALLATGSVVLGAINLPFLAAAAAAALAVGALGAYGNATQSLSAAQEELRTKLNDAKGAIEDKQKALESIDQFLEATISKENILKDGSRELTRAVQDATNRFGDLSSAVNTNITSFSGLISKVQGLRAELRSGLLIDIANARANLNSLIDAAHKETASNQGPAAVYQTLRRAGLVQPPTVSEFGTTDTDQSDVLAGKGAKFLPAGVKDNQGVLSALDIIGGKAASPTVEQLASARTAIDALSADNKALKDSLLQSLNLVTKPVREAATYQRQLPTLDQQEATTRFTGRTDYAGFETRLDAAAPDLAGLRGLKDERDLAARNTQGTALIGRVQDSFVKPYQEFLNGLSEDDKRASEDTPLTRRFNEIRAQLREARQGLDEGVAKRAQAEAAVTVKRTEREIRADQDQLRLSHNDEERAKLLGGLRSKAQEQAAAEIAAASARRDKILLDPTSDPASVRSDHAEEVAGINARLQGQLATYQREDVAYQVQNLRKVAEDALARARTANTRSGKGKIGTPAELAADFEAARKALRRIGELQGDDLAVTQREIDRQVDQREIRAGASGSGRAPRKARDVNREFLPSVVSDRRTAQDETDRINKDAENQVRDSKLPLEEASAFLDAAKRNDQFSKAGIREKQKQVNDLRIQQEGVELKIRTQQKASLEAELVSVKETAASRAALLADLTTKYGIQDKNDGRGLQPTKFGSEEERAEVLKRYAEYQKNLNDLAGADGVGGTIGKLQGQIEGANVTIRRLNAEVAARSQTGATGVQGVGSGFVDAVDAFKEKSGLNSSTEVQAAEGFTSLINKANSSFSSFIYNLSTGSVKGKDAFKGFVTSLLQDAAKMASEKASAAILGQVFSLATTAISAYAGGGSSVAGVGDAGASGFGAAPDTGGFLGIGGSGGGQVDLNEASHFAPAYNGGIARQRYAGGGIVPGVHYGRDTVPAILAPGEGVLNRRAVSLIGEGAVARMNAGAVASQAPIPPMAPKRDPDLVNVYIQDKTTQPTIGPRDILAAVHNDILQNGATKKLIHQVQLGAV